MTSLTVVGVVAVVPVLFLDEEKCWRREPIRSETAVNQPEVASHNQHEQIPNETLEISQQSTCSTIIKSQLV